MRDGQFRCIERPLHFVHKVRETQTSVYVFFGASDLVGQRFDGVGIGLQLHEGRIPRLVSWTWGLQVFDELQFETFRVGEFADARGNGLPFSELRSAVPPHSGDKFKEAVLAARQRTDKDGLHDAMLPDVARKFRELCFIKRCVLDWFSIPECGRGGCPERRTRRQG